MEVGYTLKIFCHDKLGARKKVMLYPIFFLSNMVVPFHPDVLLCACSSTKLLVQKQRDFLSRPSRNMYSVAMHLFVFLGLHVQKSTKMEAATNILPGAMFCFYPVLFCPTNHFLCNEFFFKL